MKNLAFTLIVLTFSVLTFGQNYSPKKFDEVKGKTRGAIFQGMDDDGYIYTTSMKVTHLGIIALSTPYIKVFDSKTGKIVTEKKLYIKKQLKEKGFEFVSFGFFENQPVIFCKKKGASKEFYYYGFEVDHKLNIKSGKPFKYSKYEKCKGLFSSDAGGMSQTYRHIADDGTTTVVTDLTCDASNSDKQNLMIIQLEGKGHTELKKMEIDLEVPAINNISTVSNNGKIYLSVMTAERQKIDGKIFKKTIKENKLFVINEDEELYEIELSLPSEDMRMGNFKLFVNNGVVLLNGQVLKNETNNFIGVFSGRVIPEEDNLQDIDVNLFDSDFVTQYYTERQKKRSDRRASKNDGEIALGSFYLMDNLKTDDNGAVNLYQKYHVEVRTTTTTNANGQTTTRTTYYYYYKDVIAVKTNESGELDWVKLIPIQQVTVNFDPGMGYVVNQKEGEIFLMHRASNKDSDDINEGKRKKKSKRRDRVSNKVAITKIQLDGEISSEIIAEEKEDKIYFLPNEVAVDEKNDRFIMLNSSRKLFQKRKTIVQTVNL